MKYLSREQNKLVQAIDKRNWPAVRNILENEPHFIETEDENGRTPLMWAVLKDAPDDALENMIETATVENLEHQDRRFGFTILHELALHTARVSALRRVLQRTNTKINMKDNFVGHTPLHHCLYDDWGQLTRSYEYHKEAAIVLITYGASVSIKDKNGKTPLDLYEENYCAGYEKTARNEKKQDLKELLEKISTPSEILARGPDAIKAFKDALKNGEITVVNSRLMFLGQEGSGKTSCVKAMLGKEFDKNEPSTEGIVTTTVLQTDCEDYSKWEEQENVDENERTKQVREHAIATNVAKKFDFTASTSSSKRERIASTSTSAVGGTSAGSRRKYSLSRWFIRVFKGKPVSQDTGISTYQLHEMRKKVIDKLANNSSGPSDVTCIWDYAGQLEYYITHRFFITDGSSYGVVFSFLDALDEFAKPRDHKKGQFEMTNLQTIIFWIRSIYEYAVLLHGSEEKPLINGIIASPTISLIGTHKDLLSGTDAEKQTKIDDMFDRIFKEIEGTPYERHVDRERYAVDNTTALDEGIQRLKRNVGGYLKAMARTVPINWMDFQIEVQEAGKTTLRMSLDEITKIAVKCSINEENVTHVLNYLNDVGVILYSPTNEKLRNTVITNIHMLIGIFMKIITVVEPDGVDKAPAMVKYWRKLNEGGILEEPLARYVWRNELESSEDDNNVVFKGLIELMKAFGLLFEKIKKSASEDDARIFVVPSRMKTKHDDRLEVKEDEKQTVSIYVTPKDFLPDAVYDILVVRFVSLCQENGYCDDPQLFQNQAQIIFDDKHYLRLGRISIDNKCSLKLEISRMKDKDADGTDKPARKPHPGICKEVLHVLKQQLAEVYPSKKVVSYALKVLCSVCSNLEEPHFQELEKCLKNENMSCDRTGILHKFSVTDVAQSSATDMAHQSLASTPHSSSSADTHKPACTALSDRELRELKFGVSQWYDSNKRVPMLKVLFRDKMDNYEISSETRTMDLLNILFARGHLSSQNLGLLCDTINITKQFGLLSKIKEKLPSFPDVEEGTISKAFTSHRQKLMKFGMVLTSANVTQIDQLYNTPPKKYTDGWSMISDLEDQQKISEGNMKEFTDSLKMLKLSLALNALTEESN